MVSLDEISPAAPDSRTYFNGSAFAPSNTFSLQLAPNTLGARFGLHAVRARLLPPGTEYFLPVGPAVRADWVSEGWFSIYEFPFRIGFRLPCSGLALELLEDLGVMPSQLMPAVWKVVFAVEAIGREHGCPLTLADLKYHYSLRSYGTGRVTFRIREQREHLIVNTDSGDDKFWYSAFFFIRKETLGEGCDCIATEMKSSIEDWKIDPEASDCAERVAKFLAVPEASRTWPLSSVPVAASFQVEIKSEKATPSKSGVSSRTRTAVKVDDVLAQARAGTVRLRIPRKVGKPGEAVVPQPSSLQEPIVVDDQDPVVKSSRFVKETFAAKRAEESIVESVGKRRKVIVGDHSSSAVVKDASLEEGEPLLKNYPIPGEADLHAMVAKLASSASQSLHYALSVGGGYRRAETQLRNAELQLKLSLEQRDKFAADMKSLQDRLDEHKRESAALRAALRDVKSNLDSAQSGAVERTREVRRLSEAFQRSEVEVADLKLKNQELSDELEELKQCEQDNAIYYSMTGRIELLQQPPSEWDLQLQVNKFKAVYPGDASFDNLLQDAGSASPVEMQAERVESKEKEVEASKIMVRYEGKTFSS